MYIYNIFPVTVRIFISSL